MRGSTNIHEEEELGKVYDSQLMSRLLSYSKPYLVPFAGALALAFVVTGMELGLPYLVKVIIDQYLEPFVKGTGRVTNQQVVEGIAFFSVLYVGGLVLRLVSQYAHNWLVYLGGQQVMHDLRRETFNKLLHLPVPHLNETPTGRHVTRVTNDVEAIQEMYTEVLVSLFQDLLMVIGIIGVMVYFDWKLTGLILLLTPPAWWVTMEFRKRVRKAYRAVRRNVAKLNAYLSEHLSGMQIIQIFVQEDRSRDRFFSINEEELASRIEQLKLYGAFRPFVHLLRMISTTLILWYGGGRVVQDLFTLGSLYLFLTLIEKLFNPLQNMAQHYNIMQKAMASSERIFQLLDREPEPYGEGAALSPASSTAEHRSEAIQFRDVWFGYDAPEETGEWVLKDISFQVDPGERIALVGPTGAGKTTLFRLLLRFYAPQSGTIRIVESDLAGVELEDARSRMGLVPQDAYLFTGTVRENIQLFDPTMGEDTIREAGERVQLSSIVDRFPARYETEIGPDGINLSEGQKQLISFARAVANDPDILLMDEATADVDPEMEEQILQSTESLLSNRTSISIAHRLSTIKNADRILVINKGKLVEEGSHEELMAAGGLYKKLYDLQFRDGSGP